MLVLRILEKTNKITGMRLFSSPYEIWALNPNPKVAQKCPHFFSQLFFINCEKKKSKKYEILANCLDFF